MDRCVVAAMHSQTVTMVVTFHCEKLPWKGVPPRLSNVGRSGIKRMKAFFNKWVDGNFFARLRNVNRLIVLDYSLFRVRQFVSK